MKINFRMWRTALWSLVKMERKEDWDQLDAISKWLIATRSGVTVVTVYSCVIAGCSPGEMDNFLRSLVGRDPRIIPGSRDEQSPQRLHRFLSRS